MLCRIGLDGLLQQRYTMPGGIVQMELNCSFKRIAALGKYGKIKSRRELLVSDELSERRQVHI